MPRITKEPAERRQEIIDTAMRLFYEKGYERTSITDIAREMGVAQGLCYRYFASKESIFDTALEQYADMQLSLIHIYFRSRNALFLWNRQHTGL